MRFRCIPTVERLETRECPSVSATVIGGNLVIFARNSTTLDISQTAAGSYDISENGSTPISRTGVTGSLIVNNMGLFNSPTVDIDFNGFATVKNVTATFLTFGTTTLTVHDGTITGKLAVFGGLRADTVNLGDVDSLTVNGNTTVNLFSGADTLNVAALADLKGNLSTTLIENVTTDIGSLVEKSAFFVGGHGANTYNLHGAVTGSVWFTGSIKADTFNADGTIGQDLVIALLAGNDNVDLSAAIGNNLAINSAPFGGTKTINLGGTVGNNAKVKLGSGGDTVNFTGIIANSFVLHTGFGNDHVNFLSGSSVTDATVILGFGDDIFCLDAGVTVAGTANIYAGYILFAAGNDTFNTPLAAVPANVILHDFDTVNLLTPC